MWTTATHPFEIAESGRSVRRSRRATANLPSATTKTWRHFLPTTRVLLLLLVRRVRRVRVVPHRVLDPRGREEPIGSRTEQLFDDGRTMVEWPRKKTNHPLRTRSHGGQRRRGHRRELLRVQRGFPRRPPRHEVSWVILRGLDRSDGHEVDQHCPIGLITTTDMMKIPYTEWLLQCFLIIKFFLFDFWTFELERNRCHTESFFHFAPPFVRYESTKPIKSKFTYRQSINQSINRKFYNESLRLIDWLI